MDELKEVHESPLESHEVNKFSYSIHVQKALQSLLGLKEGLFGGGMWVTFLHWATAYADM